MNSKEWSRLERTARARGIQTSYLDMAGQRKDASEETLRRLLDLLGPAEGDESIGPVFVQWDQRPLHIKHRGRKITVPPLPFGYHEVDVAKTGRKSLIISAPRKLYSNPDLANAWGVFLPMYAAHSRESWGSGNFSDWRKFCEAIGDLGANVAATLPVLAAFIDSPFCEPSPYSPASRLFWNEFYIDPTVAPEFESCSAAKRLVQSSSFKRKISALRQSEYVNYSEEFCLKRQVFELLAKQLFTGKGSRLRRLQQFLRERPKVKEYAAFRAVCDHRGVPWQNWPERMRMGELRRGDYPADLFHYYAYLQFLAQEQMDEILQTCHERRLHFYLDLPLGVNPSGFDIWRHRDFFCRGASVGAPPDAFFTKGQDWGFAPPHPHRMREEKYRYLIDYIRFQMRHTGLLRIDHVMGLHRLYWIPEGLPANAGAYVSYPAEELYAILSVESHANKTMVVGENLGTVPPEVERGMKRHGLRGMYVVQYSQRPDPKMALPEPPDQCVASLNTHDMPTFAAHSQGLDLADRSDLGLIPKKNLPRERQGRKKLMAALEAFLERKGLLQKSGPKRKKTKSKLAGVASYEELFGACTEFLLRSRAEIVLVNLEDIWGEERSQNVPGTSTERPNWRRKARFRLEDIFQENAP